MKWSQILALILVTLITGIATSTVAAEESDAGESEDVRDVAEKLTEHSDPALRSVALLTIGHIGTAEQRESLELFKTASGEQERLAAAAALLVAGESGATSFAAEQIAESSDPYRALQTLSGVLSDDQLSSVIDGAIATAAAPERRALFHFLGSRTGTLYGKLGDYLTSSDETLRELARQAAVHTARKETLELAQALRSERDADIRRQMLDISKALGDRRELRSSIVEFLEDATGDNDEKIQREAARQLTALGEQQGVDMLIASLADAESEERVETLEFLLQYNPRADIDEIRPLIQEVEMDLEADRERERQLLYELAATDADDELLAELREKFSSTTFDDRLVSVRSLGRTGRDEITDLLIRGLGEGRSDIRRLSARGLGQIGDATHLNHLRTAINGETDKEVRLELLEAIRKIRDARSVQILRFLVRDNDADIRMAIVEALDEIGLPESIQGLELMMQDRDPDIQWRAFLALLRIDADQAQRHRGPALRNPPQNFGHSIEPDRLTDTGRKLLYSGLLSHSVSRVNSTGVDHMYAQRDLLLPVAREMVVSDSVTEEVRRNLVDLIISENKDEDLALLNSVVSRYSGEAGAQLAGWYLVRNISSEFEETFEELAEEDGESVMGIMSRVGLQRLE